MGAFVGLNVRLRSRAGATRALTATRIRTNAPQRLAAKRGAAFADPCYTQIHPTCITVSGSYQSKLTLMSESLGNDGRV